MDLKSEMTASVQETWIDRLKELVEKKPLVILRFSQDEWDNLRNSRLGVNEFTVARPHALFEKVKKPCAVLLLGNDEKGDHLYFGLIRSLSAVTTLESRIKIKRAMKISPNTEAELLSLIDDKAHARRLAEKLQSKAAVGVLPPKLGSTLIAQLTDREENHGVMRAVTETLTNIKHFRGSAALQEDALRCALRVFGLSNDPQALSVDLVKGQETALGRVNILEDAVIEHDARSVPGYDLVGSDMTGKAVFERGGERLEVYTANKRPLEKVMGVDLVYFNVTRQNIVMLQYKMLEPSEDDKKDWIYRPDDQLEKEIERMKKFSSSLPPGKYEYRFNPAVFYMKFVKRNGAIAGGGGIITPLDHYEKLLDDPSCKGPRDGIRISYESLGGRYMRENAFGDLVRSGYIGAHADTTTQLKTIIDALLSNDRAVVAAIQKATVRGPSIDLRSSDAFLPLYE